MLARSVAFARVLSLRSHCTVYSNNRNDSVTLLAYVTDTASYHTMRGQDSYRKTAGDRKFLNILPVVPQAFVRDIAKYEKEIVWWIAVEEAQGQMTEAATLVVALYLARSPLSCFMQFACGSVSIWGSCQLLLV